MCFKYRQVGYHAEGRKGKHEVPGHQVRLDQDPVALVKSSQSFTQLQGLSQGLAGSFINHNGYYGLFRNVNPWFLKPKHIVKREHYRKLYEKNPVDIRINPQAGRLIYEALRSEYGQEAVRRDPYTDKNSALDFPVLLSDRRILSSYELSEIMQKLPIASFDYIFIRPDLVKEADEWLKKNRYDIIKIIPLGG